MIQSWPNKSIIRLFLALILLMGGVTALQADQAQYYYDDLGRLVSVTDGQGNMAVYNYDPVGNLLSIQKYASSTTGIGILLLMPASGPVTTQVQILGYGFNPVASNNQVSFNGTPAAVISSTANSIMTSVPLSAVTGPVTVTNSKGTATSQNPFTVIPLPVIAGISPNPVAQGSVNYNTIITGYNLANATAVLFNQAGIGATIVSGGTSTQLPLNLSVSPNTPIGAYSFSVTTVAGIAQSGTVTISVYPSVPESAVSLPLSVFMPGSPQGRPSGPETVSAKNVSVFLPPVAIQTPSGPESVIANPLSIFNPLPSTVAPSGGDTAVAPPESVSMP